MDFNKLFEVIGNLNESMSNLSNDIDPKHPREETKEDLEDVNLSFSELGTILKELKAEDQQALQKEFYELMSGEESFQDYINDVNKIINNVRARAKQDPKVQEKIETNLPENAPAQNAPALFSNYQQMFNQIGNFLESMQKVNK